MVPVPKFDVDPEVPLETMVALDGASDQSAESDQTDNIKHNTGKYIRFLKNRSILKRK